MHSLVEKSNTAPILLIATTSYAGMGSYVASIVNSFHPKDNVLFFLVEDDSHYYTKNIKKSLLSQCFIVHLQMSKVMTLLNLTLHPQYFFTNKLKTFIKEHKVSAIHCLSSFHDYKFLKWFEKKGSILLTVHDLKQHESKKALYKEIRQNIYFKRMQKCLKLSKYLLTNSKSQFNTLKIQFPRKKEFYIPFPTLITESIAKGQLECPELKGVSDYVLFFGRIEQYKGVDILVKAFLNLHSDQILVIAGKGGFQGKIRSTNIIYINRYIMDEEIRLLYENARYVVYPYISATQSGVLSIASYFKKPMILSDIPFFQETAGGNDGVIFFKSNDVKSLSYAMENMQEMDYLKIKHMEVASEYLYSKEYSESSCRTKLLTIYDNTK